MKTEDLLCRDGMMCSRKDLGRWVITLKLGEIAQSIGDGEFYVIAP